MLFHEKLDFLMKIANIQNSALGRELSFDASYISRIRNGKRGIPKNQPFSAPVAAYVVRCLTKDYQRRAVAEAMCMGRPWPETPEQAEKMLAAWLSEEDRPFGEPVEKLLTGFAAMEPREAPLPVGAPPVTVAPEQNGTGFYYGNAGKRRAVEIFLNRVCALDSPQELLLYSNEDMSWLSEDAAFAKRWAALLVRFIRAGGHIRIIHTIRRDIGEMIDGVHKWLPLYTGGAIESYYYPKLRDNVYCRTVFIAREQAAICSTSVGDKTDGMLNLYTDDLTAVRALEQEFMEYFSHCKPLMQVFQRHNARQFWELLSAFDQSEGDLVAAQSGLPMFSMPDSVVKSMARRCDNGMFMRHQREAERNFRRSMAAGRFYLDVLKLPDPATVKEGKLLLPLCDFYGQPELAYTGEEYLRHLRRTVSLLKSHENYNVVLRDDLPPNILLFVKEDTGAFAAKLTQPSMVFGLDESRMIAALWEYTCRIARRGQNKERNIQKMEAYLQKLDAALKDSK